MYPASAYDVPLLRSQKTPKKPIFLLIPKCTDRVFRQTGKDFGFSGKSLNYWCLDDERLRGESKNSGLTPNRRGVTAPFVDVRAIDSCWSRKVIPGVYYNIGLDVQQGRLSSGLNCSIISATHLSTYGQDRELRPRPLDCFRRVHSSGGYGGWSVLQAGPCTRARRTARRDLSDARVPL
jgi:hypothetical protein